VNRSTDDLIARLAADARPVKRLRPPMVRALSWLAGILLLAGLLVLRFSDLAGFAARNGTLQAGLAWLASLATGAAAVIAAAHLSLPDRSRSWALAPLPFLALWLAASGWGCVGLEFDSRGDSDRCLYFIAASGLVLTGFLGWRLRRSRPMDPRLVAATAALGAAGLSAALLQFFHPFAITWLDLGAHLAGVAAVIAAASIVGGLLRGRPAPA
jgi:hypothetical protein